MTMAFKGSFNELLWWAIAAFLHHSSGYSIVVLASEVKSILACSVTLQTPGQADAHFKEAVWGQSSAVRTPTCHVGVPALAPDPAGY